MAEIVRHKKTGGLYDVLYRGATVESSVPLADYAEVIICRPVSDSGIVIRPARLPVPTNRIALYGASVQTAVPLTNGDEVVVYRTQDEDLLVWVRPTSEMDDGRFEPANPLGAPPHASASEIEERAAVVRRGLSSVANHAPPGSTTAVWAARGVGVIDALLSRISPSPLGDAVGRGPADPGSRASIEPAGAVSPASGGVDPSREAWLDFEPDEIVRRVRCQADDAPDEGDSPAQIWRHACDTILLRMGRHPSQEAVASGGEAPGGVIPEGWVLVPQEPTEAMLDAAVKGSGADVSYADVEELWPAMLSASPRPSQGETGDA
jgi:hypothetical protein